jgi:hypothetical protein
MRALLVLPALGIRRTDALRDLANAFPGRPVDRLQEPRQAQVRHGGIEPGLLAGVKPEGVAFALGGAPLVQEGPRIGGLLRRTCRCGGLARAPARGPGGGSRPILI